MKSEIIPANQTIAKYFQGKVVGKLEISAVMVSPPNFAHRKLSSILTSNFECRTACADGETALCALPGFIMCCTESLHL